MAAPILEADGVVIAVFAVQSMDFVRFNSASVNLLTLLAEWGTDAAAKCRQVAELKSQAIYDETFPVHSSRYFEARLEQEFSRFVHDATPMALILVRLAEAPAGHAAPPGPEAPAAPLPVVCRVLQETARRTDVVARTRFDREPFAVILTATPPGKARELARRLRDAFERATLGPAVRVGLAVADSGASRKEDLIARARADVP